MGATTGIEWADATANIWTGCTKVSPACKHCYAETNTAVRVMQDRIETFLARTGDARRLKMWGVNGFRYETANWERELRALNRKAHLARVAHNNRVLALPAGIPSPFGEYVRPRVFINSLSDTFEDWSGPAYRLEDGKPVVVAQSLDDVRARFFRVAEECTELDLLLVTKRPENVLRMVPGSWKADGAMIEVIDARGIVSYRRPRGHRDLDDVALCPGYSMRPVTWPSHVWLGTTVEDREHADERIPELLKVPAKVRFLSVEPLLGRVDLTRVVSHRFPGSIPAYVEFDALRGFCGSTPAEDTPAVSGLQWVIVGGESGTNARPMHPDWVRSIRDQCQTAGVPFFFKQWGHWAPLFDNSKVGTMMQWGKKKTERILDGRTWDEVPK